MSGGWKSWPARRPRVSLMFRWRRPHGLSFRLVFFLFLSAVFHLAAFYVFKVVYPPNKKSLPRDAGVWWLLESDPQVKALLARHSASLAAFAGSVPADHGPATEMVGMRLSFDRHEPGFAPPPARKPGESLVFPDAVPALLPPVSVSPDDPIETPPPDPVAKVPEKALVWAAPGGVVVEADWIGPSPIAPIPPGAEWRFQVGVESSGRVKEAVLVQGTGGAADAEVRRQLLGSLVATELPRPKPGELSWFSLRLRLPMNAP